MNKVYRKHKLDCSTREKATLELCRITWMAHQSIGDFSHASDCFCARRIRESNFQNQGYVIDFIERAVREKLKRHKIKIKEVV